MGFQFKILNKTMAAMVSNFMIVTKYSLDGDYVPVELPNSGLYDVHLHDTAKNILYLAEWLNLGRPEFLVWKIDGNKRKHWVSKPIKGCCSSMALDGDELILSVFTIVNDGEDLNNKYGTVPVRPVFRKAVELSLNLKLRTVIPRSIVMKSTLKICFLLSSLILTACAIPLKGKAVKGEDGIVRFSQEDNRAGWNVAIRRTDKSGVTDLSEGESILSGFKTYGEFAKRNETGSCSVNEQFEVRDNQREALALIRAGSPSAAIKELEEADKCNVSFATAQDYYKAVAYSKLNDVNRARQAAEVFLTNSEAIDFPTHGVSIKRSAAMSSTDIWIWRSSRLHLRSSGI